MAKSYKATEYMYSSARIRSLETRIAGREQIARLAEAEDAQAVVAMLPDFGFEPRYDSAGRLCREDMLMAVLKEGLDTVCEMECEGAVALFRYQYDCNNVKALIKCAAGGRDAEGMLLELGSVTLPELKKAFAEKDYSAFPTNMAVAIAEAEEAFAATGDPQKIDFIIDRAAYRDMLAVAEECGVPLTVKLTRARIDLVNVNVAVRLIRMKLGQRAVALLKEAFLEGGALELEALCDAVTEGEDALAELLAYTSYSAMAELIEAGATAGELEKRADDIWIGIAREARYTPFGAEVAVGYVAALEYEIKNIRIILAGKDAGLSSDIIRERLRESYV